MTWPIDPPQRPRRSGWIRARATKYPATGVAIISSQPPK